MIIARDLYVGDRSGSLGVADWMLTDVRPGAGRRWFITLAVAGRFMHAIAVVDDFGTLVAVERFQ
jgi:hypothetical protein